jgi:hypothetical protein
VWVAPIYQPEYYLEQVCSSCGELYLKQKEKGEQTDGKERNDGTDSQEDWYEGSEYPRYDSEDNPEE